MTIPIGLSFYDYHSLRVSRNSLDREVESIKVVVALDSFKGSLTSLEAGNTVKEAILQAAPFADVIVKPLADGGEGTVEALIHGTGGEFVPAIATGPTGEPVSCTYGITEGRTAVIEMAVCAGLPLVPEDRRNPLETTTFGLGELIRDAVERGCRDFIIGLGGSATHDAGLGMLSALGFRFSDAGGKPLAPCGGSLISVSQIDAGAVDPRIFQCSFRMACDVKNPLLGEFGAARVYGPQKGASPGMVEELERGTEHFAQAVKDRLGRNYAAYPGAGAAGGLGYAFLCFLDARIERGIDIVLEMAGMEAAIRGADFVVTGEGRIDSQTAMGKGPIGVARLAKKHGATVIALAGCTADDADVCNGEGIDAFFSILRAPVDIHTAMKKEEAMKNLSSTARQLFHLIVSVQERCGHG